MTLRPPAASHSARLWSRIVSLKFSLASVLCVLLAGCGEGGEDGGTRLETSEAGTRTIYVRVGGMVKKLGIT